MNSISIQGKLSNSEVFIGISLLEELKAFNPKNTILLTDKNVDKYYNNYFKEFKKIVIKTGEKVKNLAGLEYIIQQLVCFQADRSYTLLALGGGVVSDLGGLAASVYMRGVNFVFFPTTLLAQVDASVGGKNGVNFKGLKNIIGVFNQPSKVYCDVNFLKTLKDKDFRSGLAEMIKHAFIADLEYLIQIEKNSDKILKRDLVILAELVRKSIEIKAKVVNQDEREQGVRRILNFGHTFAHGFEKTTKLEHGEAVALGMLIAIKMSIHFNKIKQDVYPRVINLYKKLGLITTYKYNKTLVYKAMVMDKKREGDLINLVLLSELGKAQIKEIKLTELESVFYDLC